MSIAVTPQGTNNSGGAASLSVASVACNAGDLLIVTANVGQTAATAAWNSIAMTLATSTVGAAGKTVYLFYLVIASTATASATVSWSGSHSAEISVSTVQGIVTSLPLDRVASNSGSSTTPSSGATAATIQASEIAFGAIGNSASTIAGTWSNGWSDNQIATTGAATLDDGFLIVSSIGAQTAAKTGANTAGGWGALCATFKGIVATGSDPPFVISQPSQHYIPGILSF